MMVYKREESRSFGGRARRGEGERNGTFRACFCTRIPFSGRERRKISSTESLRGSPRHQRDFAAAIDMSNGRVPRVPKVSAEFQPTGGRGEGEGEERVNRGSLHAQTRVHVYPSYPLTSRAKRAAPVSCRSAPLLPLISPGRNISSSSRFSPFLSLSLSLSLSSSSTIS